MNDDVQTVDEALPVGAPSRKAYKGLALLAVVLIVAPIVAGQAGDSWVRILDFALLYIMLALGLNIVVGFAGLLDLGYIAFYAVGAYMAALLASPQFSTVLQSFVDNYPDLGAWMVNVAGASVTENGIHLPIWVIVPAAALGVLGLATDTSISASFARPLIVRAALDVERLLEDQVFGREPAEYVDEASGHALTGKLGEFAFERRESLTDSAREVGRGRGVGA